MADNPLPVADLSAVHDIISAIASPPTISSEGPEQRKQGQSDNLQPRQFSKQPSMGPEGTTGEPTGMAGGQDAMTMGSGVVG